MVQPRRFTREEYHRLLEAGVIQEDERVELIEGTVVEMSPIGSRHATAVKKLNALFHQALGERGLVGVQDPIIPFPLVSFSKPQRDDAYRRSFPGPPPWRKPGWGGIRLSPFSEPQPDLVLLKMRPDLYAQDYPGPKDILLLVEVAEASLAYDRQVKLPLYAQAGIPEVWLVNLEENRVEVCWNPLGEIYQEVRELGPEDTLSPMAFPQVSLKVGEILP